jgi:hypothetical protein
VPFWTRRNGLQKNFILFRKIFWITTAKILVLAIVATMVVVQLPELFYDISGKNPVEITGNDDLEEKEITKSTFAAIDGTPDFSRAFVYQRYGLSYTYFVLKPYDPLVIVRTYESVDETWYDFSRFVGKLRPFDDQPFSYRIEEIMMEQFGEQVPDGSYFLGLYDVPKVNGWQIGTISLATVLIGVMIYFFFFFKWKRRNTKKDELRYDALGGKGI